MPSDLQHYTEETAREATNDLPDWTVREGALEGTWKLPDFMAAVDFVNRLASVAEAHDHHPDIHISYNRVTLRVWTHSEDAITEKDFRLAREVSKL